MPDHLAAFLAAVLLGVAVAGYARRDALQPTRAGAIAYATGVVAWGVALFALWFAWSMASQGPGCQPADCTQFGDALESTLRGLPSDPMLGVDVSDLGGATD